MALNRSHGKRRVSTPRLDEVPDPEAAEPVRRDAGGRLLDAASARALGARGGASARRHRALLRRLDRDDLAKDAAFRPWVADALVDAEEHVTELGRRYGRCGLVPASFAVLSRLQFAASLYLMLAKGDMAGSRLLGDSSRLNAVAAEDLAAKQSGGSGGEDGEAAYDEWLKGGGSRFHKNGSHIGLGRSVSDTPQRNFGEIVQ